MRLAFIRDAYHPHGGAERFTRLLMERLAGDGAEVHILTRRWPAVPADDQVNQIRINRILAPRRPALLRQIVFMHRVGRALKRRRYDLVQSNERLPGADIFRAGDGVHARWLEERRKHCGRIKRLAIRFNPYHAFLCRLERRMFEHPRLRAVVANSNLVRDEILARFDIAPEKVVTIHNGIDLDRFRLRNRETVGRRRRGDAGVAADVPVLLFVGSDFERKGVPVLLRAAARIPVPFQLWIAGRGRISKYRRLARRLGLAADRVVFLGPRTDVADLYAAADIFVFPTIYDPFPSVVLEAMASGLPVVTTRQCGAAEIITPGRDGFLVDDPADAAKLAAAIELLFDRRRREEMGTHAAARARDFAIDDTVEAYRRLYRQTAAAMRCRQPAVRSDPCPALP